jgi:ABC-type phosphate transport system substrate-binding protein
MARADRASTAWTRLATVCIVLLLLVPTSQCVTVVNGIGSTFAGNVYLRWISAYKATRGSAGAELIMTYDPAGSGAGKAAMQTAPDVTQTVAYGATDMPLTVTDFNNYPDLQTLPTMAG